MVYHSDDNWTAGCQEDFGDSGTAVPYTIEGGVITFSPDWTFELNQVLGDRYMVSYPDNDNEAWFFSKESVNNTL